MNSGKHHIIIVGCGRVGTELALSISHQPHYTVAVMDADPRAFERLGTAFKGRTVQGDAIDAPALKRAGVDSAHGFAAVTASDSVNIVAARLARDIFNVQHVVARVYDPHRAPIYERLALQTITSSSWGARRIEQLLLHPGLQSVYAAGNGEVQVFETAVPEEWNGRTAGSILPAGEAVPVALTRGGRAVLLDLATPLQAHDILVVSATTRGMTELRRQLHENGNGKE